MIEPTIAPDDPESKAIAGRVVRHHAIMLCCAQSVMEMVEEVARNLRGLGFAVEIVCGAEARATLLARDRDRDEPTIYVVCVQGSLKEQVLKPLRQALASHESANHHLFVAVLDLALPLAMVGQIRRFAEALERPVEGRKREGVGERREWREILAPASAERTPTRSYRALETLDRTAGENSGETDEPSTRTGQQRVIGTPNAAKIATSEKYRAVTGRLPTVPLADDNADSTTSGVRRRKTHAPKVRVKPVGRRGVRQRREGDGLATEAAPPSSSAHSGSAAIPQPIDGDAVAPPPGAGIHPGAVAGSSPTRTDGRAQASDTTSGHTDADATVPYGSFAANEGVVELGRTAPVILGEDDEQSTEHAVSITDSAVAVLPSSPPPPPGAAQIADPVKAGETVAPGVSERPARRSGVFLPPPLDPAPASSTHAGAAAPTAAEQSTIDGRRARLPPVPVVGPPSGRRATPTGDAATTVPTSPDAAIVDQPLRENVTLAKTPAAATSPAPGSPSTEVPNNSDTSARRTLIFDGPAPVASPPPPTAELVPHSAVAAARGDTVVAFPRPNGVGAPADAGGGALPGVETNSAREMPAPSPTASTARAADVDGVVTSTPPRTDSPTEPTLDAFLREARESVARSTATGSSDEHLAASPSATEASASRRDRAPFAADVVPDAQPKRARRYIVAALGLCALGFAGVWGNRWLGTRTAARGAEVAAALSSSSSAPPSGARREPLPERDAKATGSRAITEPASDAATAPGADTRQPGNTAPRSAIATPTSASDTSTPASDATRPASVTPTSASDTPVPVSDAIRPAAPTSASDIPTPASDATRPVSAAPTPASEAPTPANDATGPAGDSSTLASDAAKLPAREAGRGTDDPSRGEPPPSDGGASDQAKLAALAGRHRLWTTQDLYVTPLQAGSVSWAHARAMCDRLVIDGVGAFRLPHRRELQAAHVGGFLRERPHWSRTVPEDDRESAYVVHASTGQLSTLDKGDAAAVVCVHDRD